MEVKNFDDADNLCSSNYDLSEAVHLQQDISGDADFADEESMQIIALKQENATKVLGELMSGR